MTYRYHSTQRPVAPGTFPKRGAVEIVNFDEKTRVPMIQRESWGYIDYDRKLDPVEAESYELTYCEN